MGPNIRNYSKYLEDEEDNENNKRLVGNQEKLCLETMKMGKPKD